MSSQNVPQTHEGAVELMRIGGGFWGAKILGIAVELDLFGPLSTDGSTEEERLRTRLGFAARPADMFFTACVALGLLERDGTRLRNSAMAEDFLVPGKPRYFGHYIAWMDRREYLVADRLLESLRSDAPVTWEKGERDSLFVADDPLLYEIFWAAMTSFSATAAAALADAIDWSEHTRVLDVGGGSAAFPIALCGRHPHLSATVYDLPFVCDFADQRIIDAELTDRIATQPGDFRADEPLPTGHDVTLLGSVLHDWEPKTNREIVRRCFEALPSGGLIVVGELFVRDDRTGPLVATWMSVNMLVETGDGKNYTEGEYALWLREAGFESVELLPADTVSANGFLVGRKP